jgi:alpha-galactosidase
MTRIADEVALACPGAVVDFDVTEDRRAVGLGFLAAGKYFLINNGPYHSSFDDKLVAGGGLGANVLAFPGPARPRFLRTPMDYDTWLPSTLFLSHYLAEGSQGSQIANLASMFLGQNGMWGDLLALTDERIGFWGHAVEQYKKVREAITRAYPERTGDPGSSPEIVEKVDESGCGLVSLFSSMAVPITYVTRNPVKDAGWCLGPVTAERLPDGRARLTFTPGEENPGGVFGRIGVEAALVLFGCGTPSA